MIWWFLGNNGSLFGFGMTVMYAVQNSGDIAVPPVRELQNVLM